MSHSPPIIYTWTDEAPALATHAFLPVIRAFAGATGVPVETRDISLARRVLALFPEVLEGGQTVSDDLGELGRLVETPEANIIKLPNISASVPQMKACIAELQAKGYGLPDYPDEPGSDEERGTRARYDRAKGSAVNPVLRQGNSDRRAPKAVKDFARANPGDVRRLGCAHAGELRKSRLDCDPQRPPATRDGHAPTRSRPAVASHRAAQRAPSQGAPDSHQCAA